MPVLQRQLLTPGTTFLNSVKVGGGVKFVQPYCLELRLRGAASLQVTLQPAVAGASSHTVRLTSKRPGWTTIHFLIGPGAFTAHSADTGYVIELKNANPGVPVVIEEGQLTHGAVLTPQQLFASSLCNDAMTTAECLGALKREVDATKTFAATLPYLMEWESLLKRRFAKGSEDWSAGSREEFDQVMVEAADQVFEQVKQELAEYYELDVLVDGLEEALKEYLPKVVRGMLVWIERLAVVGSFFEASVPSMTATDHQQAVLSGEVALGLPLRRRLQDQMPLSHERLLEISAKPWPAILPAP
ncbi:hypothetical protein [Roseateles sp.]|uniref:hypothetical protein n=1 Tax=Roseateles sp. TaxID=1971397 RepID=UPI002F42E038